MVGNYAYSWRMMDLHHHGAACSSICGTRPQPCPTILMTIIKDFWRSKNLFAKRFLVGSRGKAPCAPIICRSIWPADLRRPYRVWPRRGRSREFGVGVRGIGLAISFDTQDIWGVVASPLKSNIIITEIRKVQYFSINRRDKEWQKHHQQVYFSYPMEHGALGMPLC